MGAAIECRVAARPAVVARVGDLGPDSLAHLIADSERTGPRFLRRLADEWIAGVNRFDRPGEALFGVRMDGELVGVGGLNVDPYATDARAGRVRHVYVLTRCRRLGIGRLLVEAIIEAARGRFHCLRLRAANPEAARLYERVGFRARTDVADCTHVLDIGETARR